MKKIEEKSRGNEEAGFQYKSAVPHIWHNWEE